MTKLHPIHKLLSRIYDIPELNYNISRFVIFRPETKEHLQEAIRLLHINKNVCYNKYGHINTWDVTLITDMSLLFSSKHSFNEDISCWDMSNVINTSYMFMSCTEFNQNINEWDMSNVTNTYQMFYNCHKFNQPLDKWNVKKVVNSDSMFGFCYNFNQNINSWELDSIKNCASMFICCKRYNPNKNTWNILKRPEVISDCMFNLCNQQVTSDHLINKFLFGNRFN